MTGKQFYMSLPGHRSFNITLYFPVFSNGIFSVEFTPQYLTFLVSCLFSNGIFSVEFTPQYLTFLVSCAKFSVNLSIDESTTYINEQFGGYRIKIKQILSTLQGF